MPKKIEEINASITDIRQILSLVQKEQENSGNAIIKLETHVSMLSSETIMSAMIYVQEQLGLLMSNFYRGEYDREKKCLF